MKEIKYTIKGYTNSKNEYVTIDAEDMAHLMTQVIRTMATYSELTSTSNGSMIVCNRDRELFGKRGKTKIAPGRDNTRLSILGGVVNNYYSKADNFKNDISLSQLTYIASVLNECCDTFGFDPIVFRAKLFEFEN